MERKPEQISRDIAAFERKLSEAGANEVLIEALNKKLSKLKNELKGGQMSTRQLASNLLGARKKVREMAGKDFRELISRLSRKPEYYFLKKYTKSEIKDDMARPAKPVGYRFVGRGNYEAPSKRQIKKGLADGTVYSERRPKRSDVSRVAQLGKGGKTGANDIGEDLENYSNYDEFYNVVFDYIKREENLTEEETKDICIVNESIIEAEFDGGSSPRFTGDVILGYLSNERGYMSKGGSMYAKGGKIETFFKKLKSKPRQKGTSNLYSYEFSYQDAPYIKITDLQQIKTMRDELQDLMKEHIDYKYNLLLLDKKEGLEIDGYRTQISVEDLKHYLDLTSLTKTDRDLAKKELAKIAMFAIKSSGLKKETYGYRGKSTQSYSVNTLTKMAKGGGIGNIGKPFTFEIKAKNKNGEIVEQLRFIYAENQKQAQQNLIDFLQNKLRYSNVKILSVKEGHLSPHLNKMAKGGSVKGNAEKGYEIIAYADDIILRNTDLDSKVLEKLMREKNVTNADILASLSKDWETGEFTREQLNIIQNLGLTSKMATGGSVDKPTTIIAGTNLEVMDFNRRKTFTFEEAKQQLAKLGNGWRLPTIEEAEIVLRENAENLPIVPSHYYWVDGDTNYAKGSGTIASFNQKFTSKINKDSLTPGSWYAEYDGYYCSLLRESLKSKWEILPVRNISDSKMAKGGSVKGNAEKGYEIIAYADDIILRNTDLDSKVLEKLMREKNVTNADILASLSKDWETGEFTREQLNIIQNLGLTSKMATGGDVDDVQAWIRYDGYSDKQIESVFDGLEEAGYDFPKDFKIYESNQESFTNKVWDKSNAMSTDIRIETLPGDLTRKDVSVIIYGMIMTASTQFGLGGDIKAFFSATKETLKKGYNKSKEYTKKKIHDTSKKIALDVIDNTKDKVRSNRDKMTLKGAEEIVSKKYAKGGGISKFNNGGEVKEKIVKKFAGYYEDYRGEHVVSLVKEEDGSGYYFLDTTNGFTGGFFKEKSRTKDALERYVRINYMVVSKFADGGGVGKKEMKIVTLEDGKKYREITYFRKNKDGVSEPFNEYEEVKTIKNKFADGGGVNDYRNYIVAYTDLDENRNILYMGRIVIVAKNETDAEIKFKNKKPLSEIRYIKEEKGFGINHFNEGGGVNEKLSFKKFVETLRDNDKINTYTGKTTTGMEMFYLPTGHSYLGKKFTHKNKIKAYKEYLDNSMFAKGGQVGSMTKSEFEYAIRMSLEEVTSGQIKKVTKSGNKFDVWFSSYVTLKEINETVSVFNETMNTNYEVFEGSYSKTSLGNKVTIQKPKNINMAKGGQVDDYIDEKENQFANDEYEMREIHGSDYKDIEYLGFLAIDESLRPHERLSDYLFEGEEFYRENLLEVVKMYPQAKEIYFGARIMGENAFGIEEDGYSEIDDIAMVFDMDKLNQYARGGVTGKDNRKKKPKMATGGNVNNYPSFEVAKTIRVDDMVITPGYYTYMGRENGGKGVYLNVHTKQTLGFDLDMLKSIKEKHPTDIQILMKKGGRVKKGNYSYIPQEEIDYLVTEYGKKIDGNNLLDGAYAKGNTKAPKMVRTQFEEEDYEFEDGGEIKFPFEMSDPSVVEKLRKYIISRFRFKKDLSPNNIDELVKKYQLQNIVDDYNERGNRYVSKLFMNVEKTVCIYYYEQGSYTQYNKCEIRFKNKSEFDSFDKKMAQGGEVGFSTMVREVLSKHGITKNEIFKIYVDKPSIKNPNKRSIKVRLIGYKFNDNTDLAKKIGGDLIKLGAIKETIWINNQEISFSIDDFKNTNKMATGGGIGKDKIFGFGDDAANSYGMDIGELELDVEFEYNFGNYTEGVDYEWNIARGDDFPHAITIKSATMIKDSKVKEFLDFITESKPKGYMAQGGEVGFSTMVKEVLSKHGITKNEIFKIYVDKPSIKNPNKRSIKVRLIGYKFNDNTDLAKKIGDDLIKLGAIKETIWINNQEISFSIDDFKNTNKMATGGEIDVWNLKKGDKIRTRKGDIETIERKIESGYFTEENNYSHSFEGIEFVSRPGRKMATGGRVLSENAVEKLYNQFPQLMYSNFEGREFLDYENNGDVEVYKITLDGKQFKVKADTTTGEEKWYKLETKMASGGGVEKIIGKLKSGKSIYAKSFKDNDSGQIDLNDTSSTGPKHVQKYAKMLPNGNHGVQVATRSGMKRYLVVKNGTEIEMQPVSKSIYDKATGVKSDTAYTGYASDVVRRD